MPAFGEAPLDSSREEIASTEGVEPSFKPVTPTALPGFPIDHARKIVFNYVKEILEKTDTHVTFGLDEVYPVWYGYTLGNWKALLSTTLPDQMYYEVTFNSAKDEFYLDAYKKWNNVKIPAESLRNG